MIYSEPLYSRDVVDRAGKVIVTEEPWVFDDGYDDYVSQLSIVNNWRSSHQFPMNTFQVTLRQYALAIDPESLLAQRTKRLESIRIKLRRFGEWLSLSQMQDLGGVRAVLGEVKAVDALVQAYKKSRIKHVLVDEDDYIRSPKKSGYRGYHLIYAYKSDKKATYNGLHIEMQLRTVRMHAWATAVETVDTFTKQGLKTGKGTEDWRRFFRLMSTYFALLDGTSPVPGTSAVPKDLFPELRALADKLQVISRLTLYGEALQQHLSPSDPRAHYYVLRLQAAVEPPKIDIYAFERSEVARAEAKERELLKDTTSDVVLVSVDSAAALRRAYPNYFLDTHLFLDWVKTATEVVIS